MPHWGCPIGQEVLHYVMDGHGPRQGPLCRPEPHILLCGRREGIRARPFIPAPPPALVVAFLGCFCQDVVGLATSHRHAAGGRGTRPAACGFCVQYRNHWLQGAHLGSLPTAVDPAPCGPSPQAARPTLDHPWKLDPRR